MSPTSYQTAPPRGEQVTPYPLSPGQTSQYRRTSTGSAILVDMNVDDYRVRPDHPVDLAKTDTKVGNPDDKEKALAEVDKLTQRLSELQEMLFAQSKHKVLVVIQAIDGGGKDGLIANVFGPLNPNGLRVASFKKPSDVELAHDYLWRVHQQTPAKGELVVFNRSHYEDVLVVRVHNFVPQDQWERRYDHIANFEQQLVDEGTTIVKFFLHISKDEQRERMQARIADPTKHWKFSSADLDERKLWDDYQAAFQDAVNKTSTKQSPWYVIPADRKWFRDRVVAQVLVDTLESLDLAYPPGEAGIESIVVT